MLSMPTPSRASIEAGRVLASGRLRVLRRLGEGGMGVVFEALDLERNVRVALKTMNSMTAQSLARFKREFRALQDVHHPNLVNLGELVSEDDTWFFTMELVDGCELLEYVRPTLWNIASNDPVSTPSTDPLSTPASGEQLAIAPTERFSRSEEHAALGAACDEGRLRSALRQLVSAASALHDAGVVHRDIKPSNIRVTKEGRVVLLDFGLVADATSVGSQTGPHMVGTPAYMAPEQASSTPARPEADFYSIGVVLYEALTGKVPFEGAPLQILMRKHQEVPAAPSTLAPSVPPDLDQLCVELLSVAPSARPDARKILGMLGDLTRTREKEEPRALISIAQSAVFVGRARELERLTHAYRQTRTGEPRAVIVQGESGLGKSCLLKHFCEQLASDERAVLLLRGRCYERETVPYKAFDGVVDSLASALSRMNATESRQYVPMRPGPLLQIFPVLRRWEPIANALTSQPIAMDPLELRNRAFAALRELFTRIVNERAVVIMIDDIQWADADSLLLLKELLRAPDAPQLLVLASMRTPGESADLLDATDPGRLPDAKRSGTTVRALRYIATVVAAFPCPLEVLELGRLSNDEARSLADSLLVEGAPNRLPFVEAIVAEAGGHPFFIDALARYAAVADLETATAPRLEDALLFSMSPLDPPARALLELVAVAAVPISQQALVFASGTDARQFARDIGRLRASNLVSTTGVRATDTVEPYHDRVRAAVVAKLKGSRRRELHRALALALERTESRDAEALAAHWQGARVPDRAARFASEAADGAVRALAFDRAVMLYERAISLSAADDPARGAIFEKLGNAFACGGRGARAAEAFREAAKGAKHADALDLHRRAAEQLLRAGRFDEGLEATEQVLHAVGMKFPHRMLVALLWIVCVRVYLRMRGFGFELRDTSQLAAAEVTRVDVCRSVAFNLAIVDTIRGAACQARHLVLALRCGEPYRVGCALAYEIGYLGLGGRSSWERAMEVTRLARRLCEETKNPQLDGLVTANEGIAYYLNGKFQKAVAILEHAREIFVTQCTGGAWEIDTIQFFTISGYAQLGMLQRLCEDAPRFLRDALDRGDFYGSVLLRVGIPNMRWLVRDDVAAARQELAAAMSQWSKRGFRRALLRTIGARSGRSLHRRRNGGSRAGPGRAARAAIVAADARAFDPRPRAAPACTNVHRDGGRRQGLGPRGALVRCGARRACARRRVHRVVPRARSSRARRHRRDRRAKRKGRARARGGDARVRQRGDEALCGGRSPRAREARRRRRRQRRSRSGRAMDERRRRKGARAARRCPRPRRLRLSARARGACRPVARRRRRY